MFDLPFETSLIIYLALASLFLAIVICFAMMVNRVKKGKLRSRGKPALYFSLTRNLFRFMVVFLWIAVSAAVLFLAAFIQSYKSFTKEELVAEIRCVPLEDGSDSMFLEISRIEGGRKLGPQKYILNGDQWALEGDVLKWDDWLNFVGLHTMFKLTRVRGRFVNYEDEISQKPSVFSLVKSESNPKWRWLYKYGYKLRFVSAVYGNTVYTYPAKGKVYEVYVTTSGFIARVREDKDLSNLLK
ncbi:hypothetical protein IH799_09705 [candidate division KSB1 bacterium]|nr:hypothetical protein [candidate division KSB1 bacterium]